MTVRPPRALNARRFLLAGAFTVASPEPGMSRLNATVRIPARGDTIAANAQSVAIMDVLP